jgi:hypothetical protein
MPIRAYFMTPVPNSPVLLQTRQDAQYNGNAPGYTDNGDGTISDNVNGLMWQKSPDTKGVGAISTANKQIYSEAFTGANTLYLATYNEYPTGYGPQGDAIHIYNYARYVCIRNNILLPDGDPKD